MNTNNLGKYADSHELTFCNIDRLFCLSRKEEFFQDGETIQSFKELPTTEEIEEAVNSDKWEEVFAQMKEGKRVRVSSRIFHDMLGSVPPLHHYWGEEKQSFFCGECYSGNKYYYFERINGIYYGELKELPTTKQ